MVRAADGTWNEYVSMGEMGVPTTTDNNNNNDDEKDKFELEEEEDDDFPVVVWDVYAYALRYLDLSDCGITKMGGYPIIQTIAMNCTEKRGSLIYLDLSDNPLGADFFSPDLREKKGPGSRRSSQATSRAGSASSVAGGRVMRPGSGLGSGLGQGPGLRPGSGPGQGLRPGSGQGLEGSHSHSHTSQQSGNGSRGNSGSGVRGRNSISQSPVLGHGLLEGSGGVIGGGGGGGGGGSASIGSMGEDRSRGGGGGGGDIIDALSAASSQIISPAYHLPEGGIINITLALILG